MNLVDSTIVNEYQDALPDAKITVYIPFEGEEQCEKTLAFLKAHNADFMEAHVPPELHSTILARYHAAVWPVVDCDVMRFDGYRETNLKSLMEFYGWSGNVSDVPQEILDDVPAVVQADPERRQYVQDVTPAAVAPQTRGAEEPFVNKAAEEPVVEPVKRASKASKG